MFTTAFWKGAAERCAKTFAQAMVAFLAAGAAGVLDADWKTAASVSAMAAVLSLLTSIASGALPVGPDNSPSVVEDRE